MSLRVEEACENVKHVTPTSKVATIQQYSNRPLFIHVCLYLPFQMNSQDFVLLLIVDI